MHREIRAILKKYDTFAQWNSQIPDDEFELHYTETGMLDLSMLPVDCYIVIDKESVAPLVSEILTCVMGLMSNLIQKPTLEDAKRILGSLLPCGRDAYDTDKESSEFWLEFHAKELIEELSKL